MTVRTVAPVDVLQHPSKEEARIFFYDKQVRVVEDAGDAPIVDYVGSDNSEDRYGSVIDPRGWETEPYQKNPTVLWAHNYAILPVGRTVKLTKSSKSLDFRVEFAIFNEFAREVFNMVKMGFLPGVSVGFLPKESVEYEADTVTGYFAENRKYTKQELLELSIVPVPANRTALKKAYESGSLTDNFVREAGLERFLVGGPIVLSAKRGPEATETPALPMEPAEVEEVEEEAPTTQPNTEEPPQTIEPVELTAQAELPQVEERKGAKLSKKNKEKLKEVLKLIEEMDGFDDSADDQDEEGTEEEAAPTDGEIPDPEDSKQTDADSGDSGDQPSTELVGGTAGTKAAKGAELDISDDTVAKLRSELKLVRSDGGGVNDTDSLTDTTIDEQRAGSAASSSRKSYLDLIIGRK